MNRTNFLMIIMIFASFLIGCGDDEIADQLTLDEQREFDSIAIAEYITNKGYDHSALDTTASGVIYLVLEEGNGEDIEFNDIVSLYLSVKSSDGTLFRTNIDSVLQNYDTALYNPDASYSHLVITHTQTGWTLLESNFLSLSGFIGLREGMSAVLSDMNVGGRGVFISPSPAGLQNSITGQIYNNNWPLAAINGPLIFEVYPTNARQ